MVHPCIPGWDSDGTELHLAKSLSSKRTLCRRRALEPDDIDQTEGATQICTICYPGTKPDETPRDQLSDIPR